MTLPAEADLIAMFKVSRPTVREALRILEMEGLVVLARGARSGAEVRLPSVGRAAQYAAMVLVTEGTTMADIHEARTTLEPAMARPLAQPDRSEAVALLRRCVEQQRAALAAHDYRSVLAAIHRFHELLWHTTGNSVLTLLVGMLQTLSPSTSTFLVERGASNAEELRKNMSKTVAGHRRLVDLLEAGRADEAEAFWSRYMTRAHEFLCRSTLGASRLTYDPSENSSKALSQ
jgi:DNA-binding FadR family transcriptional regulator